MVYTVGMRIESVRMHFKNLLEIVQFVVGDGLTSHPSNVVRVTNRSLDIEYKVPENDEIDCIRAGIIHEKGCISLRTIQFTTVKGVKS